MKGEMLINADLRELTHDQKMLVLQRWGEGQGAIDISAELKAQHGVVYSRVAVWALCNREENKIFIEEFREKYFAAYKVVPISSKRIRLESLDKSRLLLLRMMNALAPNGVPPKNENQRIQVLLIIKRLNETISVAHEEMEGKHVLLQQVNVGAYSGMSDTELQHRKDMLIAKAVESDQPRNHRIRSDPEGIGPED